MRQLSQFGRWSEVRFSEAVLINPTVQLDRGGVYPFVDMAAVNVNSRSAYAVEERAFQGSGSRFQVGDTLMARITPCLENGKIARYCAPDNTQIAHGSTEFIVIRGHPGTTDNDFAFYLTRWNEVREYAIDQMTGTSGRQRVPVDSLDHLIVPIPPLSEQRTIAHILGTLDDKIELNRQMNQTLEASAGTLFKSWFVDFDPVRAKATLKHHRVNQSPFEGESQEPNRQATADVVGANDWSVERACAYLGRMDSDIAALFPDCFVDSDFGPIPAGWEVTALPEAMDFKEGPGIRNWQYTNSEEGIRFINIRCIQNGDLVLSTANRIKDEEAKGKYSHFHLREWDVVVSTSGTLGRSAIVRREHLPLVLNTSVIRFRPVHGKTLLSYVHGYLNSPMFLDELESMASGSVQKNFGPMHLKKMRVVCPSFECIKQYEDIAGSLLRKLIENRAQSDVLANLRDALLPKLISGKIRVADPPKRVEVIA